MEKLLLSIDDINLYTQLDGEIDRNKILPYVFLAQDMELHSILGTDLYNEMLGLGTYTGDYLTLLEKCKLVLVYHSVLEFLQVANYRVANGGIYKRTSTESTSATDSEINNLVEWYRDKAQYYSKRLIEYLCNNSEKFPTYSSNTEEDISPRTDSYFTGWQL